MRALPVVPLGRLGVVTAEELTASGWTPAAVRHAVAVGHLERVAPGRFAPPVATAANRFQRRDLVLARRAVAAVLPVRRSGVSHLAAAVVRGWPTWANEPRVCATTVDRRVCRLAGVHLHRVAELSDLEIWRGIPVTTPARTIVDIAREFGTEAGLVTGDAALHRRDVTAAAIAGAVVAAGGLAGVAHAVALVPLLDDLAESPLESRGRVRCHEHGVAPTHSQVWIRTRSGRRLGRVDHYWDEGVVGEADGALKYADDHDALTREKRRQQAIEDLELEVVRWGSRDLEDFGEAAERIRRARTRARRRLVDGPPLWVATTRDGRVIPPRGRP